ncbi:ferritin [Prolixibacteraceae bacterium JC049]|nr:ferritin [Prolixibacteraceae bacterium JC049]
MINERLVEALNEQINAELYSSYLYLSMCAYFSAEGFSGMANWMKIQAQEEVSHANKFFDYVNERGGRVTLKPIEGVPTEWEDAQDVFRAVREHESKVTGLVNNLMDIAIAENDHATKSFLQWFVDEQVEEEASVQEICDNLKLINGNGHGLLMLDREMKSRVFVDSTQG